MGDSLHPNLTGYQLWANTALAQLVFSRASRSGSSTPSSLSPVETQLPRDGSLAAFTSATPDSFTNVNATLSKDTTNYESANAYAVRLQAATAAVSRIYGQFGAARTVRNPRRPAARPDRALRTVGRVSVHDGVQAEARSRAMQ